MTRQHRDNRPAEVAADITAAHGHVDTIVDRLCAASVSTPRDRRQPTANPGAGAGSDVADPTHAELAAVEQWVRGRAGRLYGPRHRRRQADGTVDVVDEPGILHDLVALAARLDVGIDRPVGRTPDGQPVTLEELVDQLRATGPLSREWRTRLRLLGTAMHGLLEDVHNAWRDLYQSRWTHDEQRDVDLLDQDVDTDASLAAGYLRELAGGRRKSDDERPPGDNLARLARALTPGSSAGAQQRQIVHCRHHPDRIAKYRRARLCRACYYAEHEAAR